jgi:Asp/Glu/hydantoin racemase
MMKIILINPNTSVATTEAMAEIARGAIPGVTIEPLTAPFGEPLILNAAAASVAAEAVEALFATHALDGVDGIILAAFADPALPALRARLSVPVTGIAEAGMAEAAAGGRAFCVVTTTPDLVDSIADLAAGYGHGELFLGTVLTKGDVKAVMADKTLLEQALLEACNEAVETLGAEAIVIGGGPLAVAARAIRDRVSVDLIEPVPAAVRLAVARANKMIGSR